MKVENPDHSTVRTEDKGNVENVRMMEKAG